MHLLSKHTRKDPELISSKSKSILLFLISLQCVTHLSGFWSWRKICKNHHNSQLLGCSVDVLMEMGRGNASEIPLEIPWDKAFRIDRYVFMLGWIVDGLMCGWVELMCGLGTSSAIAMAIPLKIRFKIYWKALKFLQLMYICLDAHCWWVEQMCGLGLPRSQLTRPPPLRGRGHLLYWCVEYVHCI